MTDMDESVLDPTELLFQFIARAESKGVTLYPHQEEAILELYSGHNVILNTPTGSGKSLVAEALHAYAIQTGRISYYTSPIKALVNEKFFALCAEFGAEQVGLMTGDGNVNPGAPILCCTAEILAQIALRDGATARIDDVVVDEFHFYSDRERGWAWQVPLLALPQTRFLLMSATLGNTAFFEAELTKLNGRETKLVDQAVRPVPLEFWYRETLLQTTLQELISLGRAPAYIVHFSQREAAETAQALMSIDFLTKEEKKKIAEELASETFRSPYGKDFVRHLKHGIGIHHAGLLPKYRRLTEKLAQKGRLKVICGTDTLGVGVNLPIRTVLFTQLSKYDGQKSALLTSRDFHQLSGRAGRKGFDDSGTVVAQAPEHVIENVAMAAKGKKGVKKKPPEGFVGWTEETFRKLIESKPEALQSRFQVNASILLQVLSRRHEDGCRSMRQLIQKSHESEKRKKHLGQQAFLIFRGLFERKLIEVPKPRLPGEPKLRIHADLQEDFSLHHALSLYFIDTVRSLAPAEELYPWKVLSLAESILENPEVILRKQLDRLKTIKMAEMKEQGLDYDERIAKLEELEYPKPERDFIYATFNVFAANHPWIAAENIRPKGIVREMFESGWGFEDFIREYGLQRSEGVLLRYLMDCLKTLAQNLPQILKTDFLLDLEAELEGMIRKIDSSLLDEWQQLRAREGGLTVVVDTSAQEARADRILDLAAQKKAEIARIRAQVFEALRDLANRRLEVFFEVSGKCELTAPELEQRLEEFTKQFGRIATDTRSRAAHLLRMEEGSSAVYLTVLDWNGQAEWELYFRVVGAMVVLVDFRLIE